MVTGLGGETGLRETPDTEIGVSVQLAGVSWSEQSWVRIEKRHVVVSTVSLLITLYKLEKTFWHILKICLFLKQYYTKFRVWKLTTWDPGLLPECIHFDLPDRITHLTHFRSMDFHKLDHLCLKAHNIWGSRICKVCLENWQKVALLFATYGYEAEMRILGFSWLFPRLLNILQILFHILIVKEFHKMYIKSYFEQKKISTLFYCVSLLRKKWPSFRKCENFFAGSFRGA